MLSKTLFYFQIWMLICILSSLSACARDEVKKNLETPPPVQVGVVVLKTDNIDVNFELPGRVNAFEVAEIRPQVNGIVLKRLFEEGSVVTAGKQLYQIDPAVYQATLRSAQAQWEHSKAALTSARSLEKRYKKLLRIDAVSKQEYVDAAAGLAQAQADVAGAAAAQKTARINLNYTQVFSPISGRIGKSAVTPGALVTANQTEPLALVQQLDPIYVDVTESSAELLQLRQKIKDGKLEGVNGEIPVTIVIDELKRPYKHQGILKFSDVTVDQSTGNVLIRVIVPNPENELLPGLFVRARINQGHITHAILAPQQAITRAKDGSAMAWIVDDHNIVQQVPVELGDAVGDKWLVLKGLQNGQKAIVEGLIKIQPGVVVQPVDVENKNK
jgi:membrane fusion protein (multidrug efflux system)